MTNVPREGKMGETGKWIANISICAAAAAIIVALVWRIQCSISYYDEVLNIYISYITAALGQRHLVENGYIFSMGDLFNLPFVYLFWRVTGGTEGLLLFIRFVYLGFNLVLSLVFWKVFGKYYGKKVMLLFGLILITFFPGGMYTVSYDTVALFFSLMGGVLLLGSEIRENEKTGVYRYFAGICHACMVYSYPLMAGVIVLLLVGVTAYHIRYEHMRVRKLFHYWLPYFLGGITVLGIFLLYVMYVGWENVIFFQDGYIQKSLYGREVAKLTSSVSNAGSNVDLAQNGKEVTKSSELISKISTFPIFITIKRIGRKLFELLNYMWIQQKQTLVFTLVMLIQWGIGLVKKSKWSLILIPEILLVAFFTHTKITCFGGTTMYAYLFLWAPFLFLYLDRDKKKYCRLVLLILGLTAVASFLAVGFTSIRTDKAHIGLYCGAICTLLFMLMLVEKESCQGISFSVVVILLATVCNVGMSYIDHFQGADIKECTYRMQKGVFKGMLTWEKDRHFEELKTCLEQYEFGDDAVICMTDYNYYAICLDGNLRSTEGNFNLSYLEQLLEDKDVQGIYVRENWPEVILVDTESAKSYTNVVDKVLNQYYAIAAEEEDYRLYVRE